MITYENHVEQKFYMFVACKLRIQMSYKDVVLLIGSICRF